jgi:hypothetical protein
LSQVPPITRIVLYKHGLGYFEREGPVEGDATLGLNFKRAEVSDVLKSLIVLDLDGGHVASVAFDSSRPIEQLLNEVALSIPDKESLCGLLTQLKGARIAVRPISGEPVEGRLLGVDQRKREVNDSVIAVSLISLLDDDGLVRSFELPDLASLHVLDEAVRRDLDSYLRIQLSAKTKDARRFVITARGEGPRRLRLGYTVEAPVWKATYRLLLGEENRPPTIQGWAVVNNTQDEDWEDVRLSLVSGLPVSFVHDLDTPRYIKRPEVKVQETTGVLPPEVEEGVSRLQSVSDLPTEILSADDAKVVTAGVRGVASPPQKLARASMAPRMVFLPEMEDLARSAVSTVPAQVRERKLGDLFEYTIEHPVTIRRNQAALVPIVLRPFQGRPVLLFQKSARAENPLRCVEFENTTGLTLEGGPVTVLEGGSYVGEAMLDTLKPDEHRLVPYAVELSVRVFDVFQSHDDRVSRVIVRNGQLTAQYGEVRQTTYTIHNKADAQSILYLDHTRGNDDWTLLEPDRPHEITESNWRFRLPLPPRQVTTFVVRQRRLRDHLYALTDVSPSQVGFWLEQRYLDATTAGVLRQVAAIQTRVAEAEATIQRLNNDRATIVSEQQRIRDNLKALGDRSSEKELRERFIRTLNQQEDRLEQISSELTAQTTARAQGRTKIVELISALDYEAAV